jgi:hypothetical protein
MGDPVIYGIFQEVQSEYMEGGVQWQIDEVEHVEVIDNDATRPSPRYSRNARGTPLHSTCNDRRFIRASNNQPGTAGLLGH